MEINYQIKDDKVISSIIPEDSESPPRLRDAISILSVKNPCIRFAQEIKKSENGEPSIFDNLTDNEIIAIATVVNELGELFKDQDGEQQSSINVIKLLELLLCNTNLQILQQEKY